MNIFECCHTNFTLIFLKHKSFFLKTYFFIRPVSLCCSLNGSFGQSNRFKIEFNTVNLWQNFCDDSITHYFSIILSIEIKEQITKNEREGESVWLQQEMKIRNKKMLILVLKSLLLLSRTLWFLFVGTLVQWSSCFCCCCCCCRI